MSLVSPSLMFEQCLNPIKGWFDEAALDTECKISDNVEFVVPGGRVVHMTEVETIGSGQISKKVPIVEMGISGTHMALFLIQGQGDFDVNNPGTTAKGTFVQTAVAPTGINSALVAEGGYELQTTEYDTAQTYAPGDLLSADADNTDGTKGGVLTNKTAVGGATPLEVPWAGTTRAICGVVSRGAYKNEHKQNALHFWPTYLPGTT
jgi:hypothetical protein